MRWRARGRAAAPPPPPPPPGVKVMEWSLITGREGGGATQLEGGTSEDLPLQQEGPYNNKGVAKSFGPAIFP